MHFTLTSTGLRDVDGGRFTPADAPKAASPMGSGAARSAGESLIESAKRFGEAAAPKLQRTDQWAAPGASLIAAACEWKPRRQDGASLVEAARTWKRPSSA